MSEFTHPSDLNDIYNDIYGEYLRDGGGEFLWDRSTNNEVNGSISISGRMYFVGFKCKRTELISQVAIVSGGLAATVAGIRRVGLYMRKADKITYDLVASTPNDTALFSIASNDYTIPFSVPYTKIRGEEYLFATLQVGGTPSSFQVICSAVSANFLPAVQRKLTPPIRAGQLDGQADLPTSFSGASVTAVMNFNVPLITLLP